MTFNYPLKVLVTNKMFAYRLKNWQISDGNLGTLNPLQCIFASGISSLLVYIMDAVLSEIINVIQTVCRWHISIVEPNCQTILALLKQESRVLFHCRVEKPEAMGKGLHCLLIRGHIYASIRRKWKRWPNENWCSGTCLRLLSRFLITGTLIAATNYSSFSPSPIIQEDQAEPFTLIIHQLL